jgi:hypothetical protein
MGGNRTEFDQQVSASRRSLPAEFWDYLSHNKKWWLLPILVVFVLFGVLMFLGSSAVAPFIYPLF